MIPYGILFPRVGAPLLESNGRATASKTPDAESTRTPERESWIVRPFPVHRGPIRYAYAVNIVCRFDVNGRPHENPIADVVAGASMASFPGVAERWDATTASLIAAAPDLLQALRAMVQTYTALVNSGDAGQWDPETEDAIIQARAALTKADGR